jgi:hydrogenase maturation protein HypF
MNPSAPQPPSVRRLAIAVRGVIQGVGFRPFVYNVACSRGLTGWVRNEADTVRIEIEGESAALETFLDTLRHGHPPLARIEAIEIGEIACNGDGSQTFQIVPSNTTAVPRPTIPPDLATCLPCREEIGTPAERRYGYPFTNCTHCGPRWSIIEQLPYDRPRTSMAGFSMCPDCRAEYADPADRRFHAQPIACPTCGPQLQLLDPAGHAVAAGAEALAAAAESVVAGRILALKGLGGFQLIVDATQAEAVARLRQRKRRPDRPLAIMLPALDDVRRYCVVSDDEAQTLESPQAPIVLLRRSGAAPGSSADIAESVAPGNPYLGVMLPYTPLHHLLMAAIRRPIICTSGNLSEEPMAISTEDAIERLGPIADVILSHDRPIVRPVDDSIARQAPGGLQILRRARGYAPLPIDLGFETPTMLAVGGHLKNTVAVSLGSQVVLSQHIGDLDSVLSVELFQRTIDDLLRFFQVKPEGVACDLHPDYASTRHAEMLAARWNVPLLRVQHHHAHAAACMAEHRLQGPVLAMVWDGTGYGDDGTIWGGEALVCDGAGFRRAAHLRTFALPGGDRAVREPRRSALGLLFEVFGPCAAEHAAEWFTRLEMTTLMSMLTRSVHAPRTSSMGRLFDAVACICGLGQRSSFEGQTAMALEYAADPCENGPYPLPLFGNPPTVADWEPLLRAVLADRVAGVSVGRISGRFHNALAELAAAIAHGAGCRQVVLSGGCFQNALLTERVRQRLLKSDFQVYLHHQVPPGDGGIALGQIFVAAQQTKERDWGLGIGD